MVCTIWMEGRMTRYYPRRDIVAAQVIVGTFTVVHEEIVSLVPIAEHIPSPPYEARSVRNPTSFAETDFWMGR